MAGCTFAQLVLVKCQVTAIVYSSLCFASFRGSIERIVVTKGWKCDKAEASTLSRDVSSLDSYSKDSYSKAFYSYSKDSRV